MFDLMKTVIVMFCTLCLVTACGKGEDPKGTTATVSGAASKGPINGGTVTVTDLSGKVLATGTTNSDGSYSVDVMDYKGPVIVKITGGSYIDEATGATVQLANTMPNGMRAAFGNASGAIRVVVTPLTEIAVQKAVNAGISATTIATANSQVSAAFDVDDIVATLPETPAGVPSNTPTSGENYAKALAVISKMAQTAADSVANTITADFVTNPITCANATTCSFAAATQLKWDNDNVDLTVLSSARSTALAATNDWNYLYAKGPANATQVTFSILSGPVGARFEGDVTSKTVAAATDPVSGILLAKTYIYSPVTGTVTVKATYTNGSVATARVSFVEKTGQVEKTVKLTAAGAAKLTNTVTAMKVDLVGSAGTGVMGMVGSVSTYFTPIVMTDATKIRAELSQGGGVTLNSTDPLFTITYGYNSVAPTSFAVSPVGTVTLSGGGTVSLSSGDFVVE